MSKGLKMNLQLMADAGAGTPSQTDGGTNNTDAGAGEGSNTGATENNTPSFDDVLGQNRAYKAEYDKRVKEALQAAQTEWETQQQEKITEADKLKKMNADEKAKYELDKRAKELDKKEKDITTRELKAQAGVMVTASHNPQEYNGYKVYWEDGAQIVEPQASGVVNAVNSVDIFNDIKMITEEEAKAKGLLEYIGKAVDDRFIEEVEKQAINRDLPNKKDFKIVYSPLHGTGRVAVQRVLKEMGYESVYTVPEQEMPDGMFPTCSYANPEDKSVFKLSTELADKIGANICLANDPDADRTGIAIKDDNGNWYYPNGNQLGILLMNYLLEMNKNLPANGAVISTIVSTPMLDVIAKDKNVKLYRTLTGFKYIGEKIRQFENKELDGTYLFGFEESIGYLVGTHVRDKDAVVSSLLITEMACYYDSIGSTLYKELNKLYEKYGWYKEETVSITKTGKSGLEEIGKIMENMRKKEHTEICGKKVVVCRDYKLQVEKDCVTGETRKIDLPKSDVIQFVLEDKTYITVRPSGTEPKIKYYLCVVGSGDKEANEKLAYVKSEFLKYVDTL